MNDLNDTNLRSTLRKASDSIAVPSTTMLVETGVARGRVVARRRRARRVVAVGLATVAAIAIIGMLLEHGGDSAGSLSPAEQSSPTAAAPSTRASAPSLSARKSRSASNHRSSSRGSDGGSTPVQVGIFPDAGAPASTMDFRSTTRWGGEVNGQWYVVWAGVSGSDPSMGKVLISPVDENAYYLSLPGSGTLTIESQRGSFLVCTGQNGKQHVLDTATMHWR